MQNCPDRQFVHMTAIQLFSRNVSQFKEWPLTQFRNKFHCNSSISNSSMPEQCKFPLCCRCVLVKVVIHQTWRYPLKAIQRPAGFLCLCVGGNVFTKINSKTSCVYVGRGGGVNDFIITFKIPSAEPSQKSSLQRLKNK